MTGFYLYEMIANFVLSVAFGVLGRNLMNNVYIGKTKIVAVVALILVICIILCNLIALILKT